jgi:hypothetical protein
MIDQGVHVGSKEINSRLAAEVFSRRLTQPGGWFWHRIGGSDFDTVARQRVDSKPRKLSRVMGKLESRVRSDRSRVRNLNGFFDLNAKTFEASFQQYVSILDSAYANADGFTYGGKPLIDHFNTEGSPRSHSNDYAKQAVRGKDHLSYEFIEAIYPLFNTLHTWMTGKKVLVISPFSKSIEHQYSRRNELFRDFRYPDFELVTYDTPITYNNAKDVRNASVSSRTSNWIDELELMKSEIRKLDFDVAFLSCGSYAGPLGVEIASMGKKAIYVGGVLNILFNIFGQRYNTDYVRAIINPETTIDALETNELMARSGGKAWANEALRAYLR